jgi:hypothetical protein
MRLSSDDLRVILPAALALLLAQGCSQTRAPGAASATAPTLAEGTQPHIRGVSDPNAQFTLIDRTHAAPATQQVSSNDPASVSACQTSSLQVYEAAASTNGAERTLRLAFKNQGEERCRLAGSPSIALEDENGAAIASIAVRQTGESSVAGVVAAPSSQAASASPATPPQVVNIVLPPSGEASFEIRWSSGDECPLVSSIAISIGGSAPASRAAANNFAISRPLKVCNGEVRITSLLAGASV